MKRIAAFVLFVLIVGGIACALAGCKEDITCKGDFQLDGNGLTCTATGDVELAASWTPN